jgi:hypothetical protein
MSTLIKYDIPKTVLLQLHKESFTLMTHGKTRKNVKIQQILDTLSKE